MPKKPTKTSLTRHLDKECSRVIRLQGHCVWCGLIDYEKLQCAHIFSRTYRNTRWDLKNMLCLCAGCHFYAHKNPIAFVDKVQSLLGEHEYSELKRRHNLIMRWTLPDMQELLVNLKKIGALND